MHKKTIIRKTIPCEEKGTKPTMKEFRYIEHSPFSQSAEVEDEDEEEEEEEQEEEEEEKEEKEDEKHNVKDVVVNTNERKYTNYEESIFIVKEQHEKEKDDEDEQVLKKARSILLQRLQTQTTQNNLDILKQCEEYVRKQIHAIDAQIEADKYSFEKRQKVLLQERTQCLVQLAMLEVEHRSSAEKKQCIHMYTTCSSSTVSAVHHCVKCFQACPFRNKITNPFAHLLYSRGPAWEYKEDEEEEDSSVKKWDK